MKNGDVKILLVDDEEEILDFLSYNLVEGGISGIHCSKWKRGC
jgi:DNA-binding response OmpR family regulator